MTRKLAAPKNHQTDPALAARAVGLRYVTDARPGLRRLKKGGGFQYVDAAGKTVRDTATLARIRSLVIPPAWTDVWICPVAEGHMQAAGRDARGRKQYRYHPRWRTSRDETKFARMVAFGEALPRIRRRVRQDLALPGLPRNKILATVVRLLETTLIRVGNKEYARTNRSFGLTTLREEHVEVKGPNLRFHFRGKSGKHHDVGVTDPRLARIVRQMQELPGQELFCYGDPADGQSQPIDSADVNDYLREITSADFTAKDFRTWGGTILAATELLEVAPFTTRREAKRNVLRAIESVAGRLGNTPTICRKCYIHPTVIDSYLGGGLATAITRRAEERSVLALLRGAAAAIPRRVRASRRRVSA